MIPSMCLLIALHRAHPEAPLVVAANRDELLARPASPMGVLREAGPRILGGRDLLAGGTWLAVNRHGVVGGLTNRPSRGRPRARRSRGEWPLFLARRTTARRAARDFAAAFDPGDFGAGWVLVGDGEGLFYVEMAPGVEPRPRELEPGIHILENRALEATSPKVDLVRALLAGVEGRELSSLPELLHGVLSSHDLPPDLGDPPDPELPWKPKAALAPCVHADGYGTRSSTIVVLSAGAAPPRLWHADGPPCTTPHVERSELWLPEEPSPP
jgi:uncharacterized protein with NRDE domain